MCVSVKGKHFQKYTSDWIPFIPSVTIRPGRVRIFTAGDIFRTSEWICIYCSAQKNRTNVVATRHGFWAQNIPKMLLSAELRPKPRHNKCYLSYL